MIKNQYRFFISSDNFQGDKVLITDKNLIYQIAKVLRLKIGDQIILLDNSGFEYLVSLEKFSPQIEGHVLEKKKNQNEPGKKIILCQSFLKSDKFEQVLKFCTNLGVVSFVPFISENSIVKEINPHKLDRYQKIIRESVEQSGRAILPELNPLITFKELLKLLKKKEGLKLIGWEQEKEKKLTDFKEQIEKTKTIYLLIGPEGGFSEEEVALTQQIGCLPFSLGKLILRSEIAGLVSSALIINL